MAKKKIRKVWQNEGRRRKKCDKEKRKREMGRIENESNDEGEEEEREELIDDGEGNR